MSATIILSIVNAVVFSKPNVKKQMQKVDYYTEINNIIKESANNYIMQSGFDESIMDNVISKEKINNDIDKVINATVSPFAIRPGEIKVFDGKDGYVSMNQIIHKINVGHINDLHFKILELVNKFEFMTSRQIFQMLEWEHVEIESQDKLNNKLEQLTKSKILTRYYF